MKVAHVSATFPPYLAGIGNVAFHNARCLADLGHDVTVYTARIEDQPRTPWDSFAVDWLRPVFKIGLAPFTPGLLKMPRYDLVHLHYPFIFGAEMVLLNARLRRQPFVLTYHNDLLAPGAKGALFRIYERVWATSVLRAARKIIVPSLEFARASPLLAPLVRNNSPRIVEVPNGVDTALFSPRDPDRSRKRFGPTGVGPLLVFVGAMDSAHHPKGGVPILLEAMTRLASRDVRAILVGAGDRLAEYRNLAASLGLASRVRFTGRISDDELADVYAAATIVVQPSQLFETFGMAAAQGMACGRPVIVSNLPGVARMVREAGGGLLVPPGDPGALAAAIDSLLRDPGLRAKLGSEGRAGVVARYEWRTVGSQLLRTYHDALGTPR